MIIFNLFSIIYLTDLPITFNLVSICVRAKHLNNWISKKFSVLLDLNWNDPTWIGMCYNDPFITFSFISTDAVVIILVLKYLIILFFWQIQFIDKVIVQSFMLFVRSLIIRSSHGFRSFQFLLFWIEMIQQGMECVIIIHFLVLVFSTPSIEIFIDWNPWSDLFSTDSCCCPNNCSRFHVVRPIFY